jgi:hypothetical protein
MSANDAVGSWMNPKYLSTRSVLGILEPAIDQCKCSNTKRVLPSMVTKWCLICPQTHSKQTNEHILVTMTGGQGTEQRTTELPGIYSTSSSKPRTTYIEEEYQTIQLDN